MQILSTTAFTPQGNFYKKTKAAATTGMVLAGTYSAAREVSDFVKVAPKLSKSQKAIAIIGAALSTFAMAGIGKLFGNMLDSKVNKDREEQTDRFCNTVERITSGAENIEHSQDCDCAECNEDISVEEEVEETPEDFK